MASAEPSGTGKGSSSRSTQLLQLLLGSGFLLLGVAGLVFIRCPSAAQAYGLVISLIIGAFVLTLGLTGMFQLSATIRGISSAGAGTIFLVLFFFVPGVLESIQCSSDHTLHFRVCEQAGCPAVHVAKALVSVRHLNTATVEMNDQGEGFYRYGDPAVGQRVQIWATAEGFARSPIVEHELTYEPASSALIPMSRPGEASATVAIPSVAIGTSFPPVNRFDLARIDELVSNPAGREGELAAVATAAFAQRNYEATVKLLEAARRTRGPDQVPTEAPYLAASYFELGREQEAKQVLEEVRRPVQEAGEASEPELKPSERMHTMRRRWFAATAT